MRTTTLYVAMGVAALSSMSMTARAQQSWGGSPLSLNAATSVLSGAGVAKLVPRDSVSPANQGSVLQSQSPNFYINGAGLLACGMTPASLPFSPARPWPTTSTRLSVSQASFYNFHFETN